MSHFTWIDNIPEDQLELVSVLLYCGFRLQCTNLSEKDKELVHSILDRLNTKNSKAYRAFLKSVDKYSEVYKRLADS